MGIKNLKKFLDKYAPKSISITKYENYKNKTIAIDTSIILYKYIAAMRKTGKDLKSNDGHITSHLHGILNLINKLLTNNITPIFVFDGKPPEIKKETLQKRYEAKKLAESQLELDTLTLEEKIAYFMQSVKISPEIIQDTIELLTTLGIPYVIAPEEADSQCVCLIEQNIADAVATEDMDLLTFGAKKLLRDFFSTKEDSITEINLDDALKYLKMDQNKFIDLCILLGCDYLPTVEGIGYVKSFNYITQYKSLEGMFKVVNQPENYDYNTVREYFKNATSKCIIPNKNDMKVKKTTNIDIQKLLIDKYSFNLGKYNSFIIARNKFFE